MLDQFLWGHSSRVCDISCFKKFLQEQFWTSTIRVSNGLDPDQGGQSVGPGLGPNCLQRCSLSADDNVCYCILEICMYAVKR